MQRVRSVLAERGLDALVVSDLVTVRWLCGARSSNAAVVVADDRAVLVTDSRYFERARREVVGVDVRQGTRDLVADIVALLPAAGRVGIEDCDLTVARYGALSEAAGAGRSLVGVGDALDALRAVKTASEVASIRAAAALGDAVLDEVLGRGVVGRREIDVVADLEAALRRAGAARGSFDAMVAFGPHADSPHSAPTAEVIGRDGLLLVDFGVELDGWCSDGTRTWATGEGLGADEREIHEVVRRAQAAGLEAIRPGVLGREADAAARAVIDAAGYQDRFGHGLGHGVGMRVHEEPRLTRTSETALVAGHVVSVEPGVYLPGRFGVRIEDLVVVTEDGMENLSGQTKALTVVD